MVIQKKVLSLSLAFWLVVMTTLSFSITTLAAAPSIDKLLIDGTICDSGPAGLYEISVPFETTSVNVSLEAANAASFTVDGTKYLGDNITAPLTLSRTGLYNLPIIVEESITAATKTFYLVITRASLPVDTLSVNGAAASIYGPDIHASVKTHVTTANIALTAADADSISIDGVVTMGSSATATKDLVEGINTVAIVLTKNGVDATYSLHIDRPASTAPTVTLTPGGSMNLAQGSVIQFYASVTNLADTSVTWHLNGQSDPGTVLTADGKLTISSTEPAGLIDVLVQCNADPDVTDRVEINVVVPSITGVTVSPTSVNLRYGSVGHQQLSAVVSGLGTFDDSVTWWILGQNSVNTTIDQTGYLTSAADETARTFTVYAAATADASKMASATVHLTTSSGGGGGSGGGSSDSYYTITATAGEGGTITPGSSVSVRDGAHQTFTMKPNAGYVLSDVLVDGKSVGAKESYTFERVRSKHTIEAKFAKTNSVVETPIVALPNPSTGSSLF